MKRAVDYYGFIPKEHWDKTQFPGAVDHGSFVIIQYLYPENDNYRELVEAVGLPLVIDPEGPVDLEAPVVYACSKEIANRILGEWYG